MPHDDGTSKQTDNPWKANQLSEQVCKVAIHENKTGFLDGMAVKGLIKLKQVAEAEPSENTKRHAKKEQVTKVERHLPHDLESKELKEWMYVN